MKRYQAQILLRNLIKRIRPIDQDRYDLDGCLTGGEYSTLEFVLAELESDDLVQPDQESESKNPESSLHTPSSRTQIDNHKEVLIDLPIQLDQSVLKLPDPSSEKRICIDFGTAMSKVTFVRDETEEQPYEDIVVLPLGGPGDQEEVDELMLVSSVFIDEDGLLWFGQQAVKRSMHAHGRKRLDNIKHYLSVEGDGLNSIVPKKFNPTDLSITYGDMVLAYLMFLTWAVNQCLEDSNEPRNIIRRFAVPCFSGTKLNDMSVTLGRMLGDAQILSDTFSQTVRRENCGGISLTEFKTMTSMLRRIDPKYSFVSEAIVEPMGVAGSIMSWKREVNVLLMVIDVGAGTSDFGLYRLRFGQTENVNSAIEVEIENPEIDPQITEAGNYLDGLLRGLILKKAAIDSQHEHWENIIDNLELDLRNYKERLFLEKEIMVRLFNDDLITIGRDEFLDLEQVKDFGKALRNLRDSILESVDFSWLSAAPFGALGVALTGGGATLPMVEDLARGEVVINGKTLKLVSAKKFPLWLKEDFPEFETNYARLAVSIGGARKRIIGHKGMARITAGDAPENPVLEGHFTKGI